MFKKFVAELKRRKVLRVAGVYAVVAWAILRGAESLFPALNLPHWAVTLVAVMLMVAFPIALIITWAFELTPDGIKRTEASTEESPPTGTGWIEPALLVAIVVVIGLQIAQSLGPGTQTEVVAPAPELQSIAVLPFTSFSDDVDNNYFADGLTEEIIHDLAQLPGLKVSGRTSSFHFKNQNQDLREIARALGVANLLEGSVRRTGDRVRVTVQLIAAADGFHLWSQTYDRRLDDMLAIQDDVAGNVANALKVKLLGNDSPATTKAGETYQQYLTALALLHDRGRDELTQARDLFRGLIDGQPDNVDALAGFAEATMTLAGAYLTIDFESAADEAIEAIEHALKVDPKSVKANVAAGLVYTVVAHRTDERRYLVQAEQNLARAVQRAPNDAEVLAAYGTLLNELGRHEAAAAVLEPAAERDPLAAGVIFQLVAAQIGLGRLDEARTRLLSLLERNPTHTASQLELGELLISQGKLAEALPWLIEAHASRTNPRASFALAHVYLNLGMSEEVERTIAQAQYTPLIQTLGQAILYNMRGDDAKTSELARDQLARTKDRIWRPLLIATALQMNDLATARAELEELEPALLGPHPEVDHAVPDTVLYAANLLMREGAHDRATRILTSLLARLAAPEAGYDPIANKILRAKALAQLGRNDDAMAELEAARMQGFRTLWDFDNFQRIDRVPQFEKLREEAAFRAFIAAIEADNESARARVVARSSSREERDT